MKKRINIKNNLLKIKLLVQYIFLPLSFAGIIYAAGNITSFLISYFIPFFQEKEYIFIFIFFILSLKSWSKKRWGKIDLWKDLGFLKFRDNISSPIFREELYKSFFIILFWCLILIFGGFLGLRNLKNYKIIFDILFTATFVGVAEELLFRVWLFEELNLFLSKKNTIIFQSIIFSLVHPYNLNENLFFNILIKIGLFLLGTYLNLLRLNYYPKIFPSIAFHGGIVGFMFLAKSLLEIKKNYPILIYGTQYETFINPISGLFGIFILLILNYSEIKALRIRSL